MSLDSKKTELLKKIIEINDIVYINNLLKIINTSKPLDWNQLPDNVKTRVKKALKEADKGIGTPHEIVMKKYKKRLKLK